MSVRVIRCRCIFSGKNDELTPDFFRRVLCYATANLSPDQAESMVPSIDPEQVRKLAGWGLTQNDRASFVGWSQSLISLGF